MRLGLGPDAADAFDWCQRLADDPGSCAWTCEAAGTTHRRFLRALAVAGLLIHRPNPTPRPMHVGIGTGYWGTPGIATCQGCGQPFSAKRVEQAQWCCRRCRERAVAMPDRD